MWVLTANRAVAIKPDGNVKWYVNTGKAIHCTLLLRRMGQLSLVHITVSFMRYIQIANSNGVSKPATGWNHHLPSTQKELFILVQVTENSMPSMQMAP